MQLMFSSGVESAAIDSTGDPKTKDAPATHESPIYARPGHDQERSPAYYMPDPTVGGKPAPGNINGYNNYPEISWSQNHQPRVSNVLADLLPINNPVQGNVGRSAFASRQYSGVLDQLASYSASLDLDGVAANMGIVK